MTLMHRRRGYPTAWVVAPILMLGSTIGVLGHAPAALASMESQCGSNAVGAHFSYRQVGGQTLSGDTYKVLVINESCAPARTVVAKLTHAVLGSKTADGGFTIKGGPSGWSCEGKGTTATTHKPPAISGDCYLGKLLNPTKLIYWSTAVD
jgi:hypothetical protein